MSKSLKKYWKLFASSFYISAFTFGGGYVIIPLMQKKFVTDLKWLDEPEMMDLAAIAQSAPGAIAVNAAILLGYKIAGIMGAMLAILGTVLPPMIIITVISFFYEAVRSNAIVSAAMLGMQAGVAAVICDVVIRMTGGILREKSPLLVAILLLVFIATFVFHVNVIYLILSCIGIGLLVALIRRKKPQKSGKKLGLDKVVESISLDEQKNKTSEIVQEREIPDEHISENSSTDSVFEALRDCMQDMRKQEKLDSFIQAGNGMLSDVGKNLNGSEFGQENIKKETFDAAQAKRDAAFMATSNPILDGKDENASLNGNPNPTSNTGEKFAQGENANDIAKEAER